MGRDPISVNGVPAVDPKCLAHGDRIEVRNCSLDACIAFRHWQANFNSSVQARTLVC